MPASYFSQPVDAAPTNSETLERSLAALRLELPVSVASHHEKIVRREINRLTDALSKIARGYPCETKEDMQRMAKEAIPQHLR